MGILLRDKLDIETPVLKIILNKDDQYDQFKEDKYRVPRTLFWRTRIKSDG